MLHRNARRWFHENFTESIQIMHALLPLALIICVSGVINFKPNRTSLNRCNHLCPNLNSSLINLSIKSFLEFSGTASDKKAFKETCSIGNTNTELLQMTNVYRGAYHNLLQVNGIRFTGSYLENYIKYNQTVEITSVVPNCRQHGCKAGRMLVSVEDFQKCHMGCGCMKSLPW